jgi:hypothetical protein
MNSANFLGTSSRSNLDAGLPRLVTGSRPVFTNDFREEGLPGIGTQVLIDDVTDKLEKGTFALAYPLSHPRVDTRT